MTLLENNILFIMYLNPFNLKIIFIFIIFIFGKKKTKTLI
jgi:hypothetical protein